VQDSNFLLVLTHLTRASSLTKSILVECANCTRLIFFSLSCFFPRLKQKIESSRRRELLQLGKDGDFVEDLLNGDFEEVVETDCGSVLPRTQQNWSREVLFRHFSEKSRKSWHENRRQSKKNEFEGKVNSVYKRKFSFFSASTLFRSHFLRRFSRILSEFSVICCIFGDLRWKSRELTAGCEREWLPEAEQVEGNRAELQRLQVMIIWRKGTREVGQGGRNQEKRRKWKY